MLMIGVYCCQSGWTQIPDSITFKEQVPVTEMQSPPETAPANSLFIVRKITINGNRKTRNDIILREIPFRVGEGYPLPELVKKFEGARRQLMNTSLFHEVIVALKAFEGFNVDVMIDVKERWYVFPIPYLKPVDRNLNQWIVEQKASLSRVNYGLKLLYNNATGRNDKFRVWLIAGYTKQFSFSYDRIYIDKKMKWGMNLGFAIGKNRELNYNTINDKQVFLKDKDNYVRSFVSANLELTYRPAIKIRQYFGIGFTKEDVMDTIIALNPSYFKEGRDRIQFPEVYYKWTYYDLDYNPYPTKGYASEVIMGKKGINRSINLWSISAKGSGSWHTGKKTFLNVLLYGSIRWPFHQPYFMLRFLGYSDVFLQGYEYYVIDGVAGGYIKSTFTRELLNFRIKTPTWRGRILPTIPVRIFGKVFGNAGYVHNPQPGDNSLSNKMLFSGGFGIDVLTLYDFTLKMEWTFNQLGQNGLFLHRKSIF